MKERIKALSLLSEPATEKIRETPVESDLSQHFTSSDDDSKMIADLLGWSTPEDNPQTESSEPALEKEEVDFSEPEIHTDRPEPIQVNPMMEENDSSSLEAQEEDSESPKEQALDSDSFPFETGGLFSDEEQIHTEEESSSTLEEAAQEVEENDLLQPPAYGEAIIIPQEGDDIRATAQETETESLPFAFEENDPFAQSEQVNSEEEDLIKAVPLDASLGLSKQSDPLSTSEEEESIAAPLPTHFEETPSTQDPSDETAGPALSDELIEKTVEAVQETAERIVKEMLPDLVKSSLSQETIAPIVEGVAWELIPPLAEIEIKKEIKRLQPEKEDS